VLLLDEEIHFFHVIGIVTILFGVWLSTSNGRKPA
jgi:drug/metabolite transporter (DMT)-like permease